MLFTYKCISLIDFLQERIDPLNPLRLHMPVTPTDLRQLNVF